jgi:hypothetical protein
MLALYEVPVKFFNAFRLNAFVWFAGKHLIMEGSRFYVR